MPLNKCSDVALLSQMPLLAQSQLGNSEGQTGGGAESVGLWLTRMVSERELSNDHRLGG